MVTEGLAAYIGIMGLRWGWEGGSPSSMEEAASAGHSPSRPSAQSTGQCSDAA